MVTETDIEWGNGSVAGSINSRRSSNAPINTAHQVNTLPFFEAVRSGILENVAQILTNISDGASASLSDRQIINERDFGGDSALHLACMKRYFPIAEFLLQRGADHKLRNAIGKVPFDYVRDKVALQRMEDLLFRMSPAFVDVDEETKRIRGIFASIRDASFEGNLTALKKIFISHPEYVDRLDEKGYTGIMFSCMRGQMMTMKYYIDMGADPYARSPCCGRNAFEFLTDLSKVHEFKVYIYWQSHLGQSCARRIMDNLIAEENERQRIIRLNRQTALRAETLQQLIRHGVFVKTRMKFSHDCAKAWVRRGMSNAVDIRVAERLRELQTNEEMAFEDVYAALAEQARLDRIAIAKAQEDMRRQLARQKAEKEERERLEREAEDLALKLKLAADAKERARLNMVARNLTAATIQANREWEDLQCQERQYRWLLFVKDKPKRIKIFKRMRLATKGLQGSTESAEEMAFPGNDGGNDDNRVVKTAYTAAMQLLNSEHGSSSDGVVDLSDVFRIGANSNLKKSLNSGRQQQPLQGSDASQSFETQLQCRAVRTQTASSRYRTKMWRARPLPPATAIASASASVSATATAFSEEGTGDAAADSFGGLFSPNDRTSGENGKRHNRPKEGPLLFLRAVNMRF